MNRLLVYARLARTQVAYNQLVPGQRLELYLLKFWIVAERLYKASDPEDTSKFTLHHLQMSHAKVAVATRLREAEEYDAVMTATDYGSLLEIAIAIDASRVRQGRI